MRYGHMVRRYQPAPETAPRKFTFVKTATTTILDIRRLILSIRGPRLVLLIICLPFLFAILRSVQRRRVASKKVLHQHPLVPHQFDKYGYEAIREERDKDTSQHKMVERTKVDLNKYLEDLEKRRRKKGKGGVSLIAACKDRNQSLSLALPSWDGIKGVKEIVLVDWGSKDDIFIDMPFLDGLLKKGKLSLLRVTVDEWVLGRAYNLAAQAAVGDVLLKVDCDTVVEKQFLSVHSPRKGVFYTVHWGTERNENEQALRGVWMANKADFWNVGGYDERIIGYGYEDVDLYSRLEKAGLSTNPIDLGTLRHSISDTLLWERENKGPGKAAVRMNEAVIKQAKPWKTEFEEKRIMTYEFKYSEARHDLAVNIISEASNPLEDMPALALEKLRIDTFQKSLHDDFNIPWDILPSIRLADLEYLSDYLEKGNGAQVIVVSLEGSDTLSNVFNLVSAIQLGMRNGYPVIAVWCGPSGARVDQSGGSVVNQVFDLEASNALFLQASSSASADMKEEIKDTRLIGTNQWPCVEKVSVCGEKYDRAYEAFMEIDTSSPANYEQENPIPLSAHKHVFLRLSNKTRIGTEETRGVAFKALVASHMVREEQQEFGDKPKVGIIAVRGESFIGKFAADVRKQYGKLLGPEMEGRVPIVGPTHLSLRWKLPEKNIKRPPHFCQGNSCAIEELARELAEVFVFCNAVEIYPELKPATKRSWMSRKDYAMMMAADLRLLVQKY